MRDIVKVAFETPYGDNFLPRLNARSLQSSEASAYTNNSYIIRITKLRYESIFAKMDKWGGIKKRQYNIFVLTYCVHQCLYHICKEVRYCQEM